MHFSLSFSFLDLTEAFYSFVLCVVSPEVTLTPAADSTLSIKESQFAVIVCNATGNPKPTISWTKDGNPLLGHITPVERDGELIQGTIRTIISTLNISNATFADTGDYRCNASFVRLGETKSASKSVRLEVQGQ